MNFLLLGNPNKELTKSIGNAIETFLSSRGHNVYAEDWMRELGVKALPNPEGIDMAIVLGGDGTILRAAHRYIEGGFPFLGVNLGRVGVLACATPEDYEEVLKKVLQGDYHVEKRTALEGALRAENGQSTPILAFNEVGLHRGESLKMLHLGIKINESNDTRFYADGIIVATPTGSSAYCLSGGGPLLTPSSHSFVLTPICPQLRTITSLVVSSSDKIAISPILGDEEKKARLEIDGIDSLPVGNGDVIELLEAKKTLNIVAVQADRSLYEPIFKVTNTFR